MTLYMDYTSPNTQFFYDVNSNTTSRKDACNYINTLSIKELNTLDNTSLLDIFLSKSSVVEPHYHQNAAELVYCISGAAVVSLINPFTNELLHFPICPGQVANVPQGWWHYEIATEDCTHLLAIFNAPVPEVILGSDILTLTPAKVLAHTYCLNEEKVKDTLAPIKPSTFIGPPAGCCEPAKTHSENMASPNMYHANYSQPQMAPMSVAPHASAHNSHGYYGYSPYTMNPPYIQPYDQQYRQQPYVQPYPGYIQSGNNG